MNNISTDQLGPEKPENLGKPGKRKVFISRLRRKMLRHIWLTRIGIILFLIAGVYLTYILLASLFGRLSAFKYLGYAKNFILTPQEEIQSMNNRTNILILGKGGEGHEAPDLTDTIIFASVSHSKPSIILVSLPRDIWIPELRTKLNSVYYWGNIKQENGGLILAKSAVEEIVGQPIQYGLVLDFQGFKEIVDVLEGVEVEVENPFTDERYPLPGKEDDLCDGDPEYDCRYETIRFEEGIQLMDGETALKFVRSRNAEGDEGTDLARAARQEKVIEAVKKRLMDTSNILSPKRIKALVEILSTSVETDIDPGASTILARRMVDARDNMETHVLPEDLLVNPPASYIYDNLYVFVPVADDWNETHKWTEEIIE